MLGMLARTLAIALLFVWMVPISQAATPAAKEDRLTADNYGKIQNGMTTAEVKEILGPPQLTVTSGSNHDSSMEWRTKTPPVHKIEVRFREGAVVSKSTSIDFAAQAAKAALAQLKPNFEKLSLGMTEQEVQAQVDRASAGRSGMTWLLDQKFAYVIFQDGKAIELDCSEVVAPNRDISPANYRRIHVGMELAGVEAILGPAAEKNDQSGSDRYTWHQGKVTLAVVVRNGKVTAKTSSIKDVPLVHFEKTADDRFDAALANLTSADAAKHLRAVEFFDGAPLDPARADEVARLLVRSLASKDARITRAAEQALRKWATKESVDYFLKIIDHPLLERNGREKNMGQIALALDILARLKEPAAVPGMVRMLKHFFNRSDAIEALKRMGPELAEKELLKYVNDPIGPVRQSVEEILQEFRDGGPRLPTYLRDLKSPSWELRLGAVQEIGKMYVHPRRRA
jgi:hypothetical protein